MRADFLLLGLLGASPTAWAQDADSDGLNDTDEASYGSDPNNPDSDGDAVPDGAEVWVTLTDPVQHEGLDCLFHTQQIVSGATDDPITVYAADLDGDGDLDVIAGTYLSNMVAWYENLGGGLFGGGAVISSSADGVYGVFAADLDGDADIDVLSASVWDNTIAWYENLGGAAFGPGQVISSNAIDGRAVYAVDLDGDGDSDVLSASHDDGKIAWYENDGGGTFAPGVALTTSLEGAQSVFAIDFDADGDADVVAVGHIADRVIWFENLGNSTFGPGQDIHTGTDGAVSVHAADLDGDGDPDVLVGSTEDNTVAWFENTGSGTFGARQIVDDAAAYARGVHATDLDSDGDQDILSANRDENAVVWYENVGGSFAPKRVVFALDSPYTVYAGDFNGDGFTDVLTAARDGDKVAWYPNQFLDTDADGLPASSEWCISRTDPSMPDTDGGCANDLDELWDLTDPLDSLDDVGGLDVDEDGYSVCDGDCDDTTASVGPHELEVCNNLDDDCNGEIDEDGVCAEPTQTDSAMDHDGLANKDGALGRGCGCAAEGTKPEGLAWIFALVFLTRSRRVTA